MKIKISRIEEEVVTVELEDGTLLDIARRWFVPDIEIGQEIEFDTTN